jgi:hypothetical protein
MIAHKKFPRPAPWTDNALPTRYDYRGPRYARLYSGTPDPPCRASLLDEPIIIFCCDECASCFYGSALIPTPPCPSCEHGRLKRIGTWNLRTVAWPWLAEGEE